MTTEISEKPIIFSGPMVKAILDGRKTQTRRVVKGPIPEGATSCGVFSTRDDTLNGRWQFLDGDPEDADSWGWIGEDFACPYGKPGDRLWVRETFCQKTEDGRFVYNSEGNLDPSCYHYAADGYEVLKDDGDGGTEYRKDGSTASPWKPSIFMPRDACRILLEITDIRVQRLQEISEADAKCEGVGKQFLISVAVGGVGKNETMSVSYRCGFRSVWNAINKPMHGWDANPWIWCVSFKTVGAK